MKALLRILVLALGCVLFGTGPALAHEMTMAEMEVRETSPGEFWWQWSASNDKRPLDGDLVPHFPESCTAGPNLLHCGTQGLRGRLSVDGVAKRYSAALVRVTWLDGQSRVYTITGARPSVELHGGADDRRDFREVFVAYGVLGVQHILGGTDHLLFVAGLLFLVGFRRRLLGTITAFTLAHSLTLALSALGILTLRPSPVEAAIALSILLVASEALRSEPTLARRMPALVSFLFGLVHGLGFAGALKEVGLPERHLSLALVSFNLGVEAGQLLMVGLVYGLVRLPISRQFLGRARTPALYAIGAMAAYWSWARVAALVL